MNFEYLKKNYKKIILLIVALFLVFLFLKSGKAEDRNLKSYEVERGDLFNETFVFGKTSPEEIYDLAFKISGRLAALNFDNGDLVKKSELLARLDSSSIYSDISKQQSKINIEQKRLLELTNSVTEEELDVVRAEIERAKEDFDNKVKVFESELSETVVSLKDILESSDIYFNNIDSKNGISLDLSNSIMNFADRDRISNQRYSLDLKIDEVETLLSNSGLAYDSKYENLILLFDQTTKYLDDFYIALKETDQTLDEKQNVFSSKNLILNEKKEVENEFVATRGSSNDITVLEKKLTEAKVGNTDYSLDYQKAIVNDKRVELSSLYTDLRNYSILSPISGVVYSVESENFETVSSGEVVISVIEDKPLVIFADVAESDITYMGIGSVAEVTFDAIVDRTYLATVKEIESRPEVRNSVSTYTTTLEFKPDQDLSEVLSGMSANISVKSGSMSEVLQLPASVIYSDENGSYVLKEIEGSKVKVETKKVYIQKGFTSNSGKTEIKSGLEEGDNVFYDN